MADFQAQHSGQAQGSYPVQKSEQEWRESLSPEQFRILRQKGTEPAFRNQYCDFKGQGVYRCAGCDAVLFDSNTKYDSGSGWPSFWQPVSKERIKELPDSSHNMYRIEAVCANCGGHLGHVFEDGPQPTGLRYCMNSASLSFEAQ